MDIWEFEQDEIFLKARLERLHNYMCVDLFITQKQLCITYVWIVGEREKTKELKKCLFPFLLTKQEEQCLNWLGSLGCGLECKRTGLEYHFDEQNEIRLSIAFISQ